MSMPIRHFFIIAGAIMVIPLEEFEVSGLMTLP